MKLEDVRIGMKVVPHSKSDGCSLARSRVLDKAKAIGQKFLYVVKKYHTGEFSLSDKSTDKSGDWFLASDFEPYVELNWVLDEYFKDSIPKKEKKIDDELKKIEQLEKEIAELREMVEADSKPKKDWPDSFEEAMMISHFWGMTDHESNRYLILPPSNAHAGLAVSAYNTWTSIDRMNAYWEGKGKYDCKLIKFDTAKELYQWLADGEK